MDTESLQNFGERVAADETLAKVRFRHENDLVALVFVDLGDQPFQHSQRDDRYHQAYCTTRYNDVELNFSLTGARCFVDRAMA